MCKVPDGWYGVDDVMMLEALMGQENDQKPVKRIEFQSEQEFHEKWKVPKV